MLQSRFFPYVVLFIGVLIVSASAIFIRYAQAEGVPSLVVASWRLILAAAALTPLTLSRHRTELRALSRQEVLWATLAGAFLAIHLATWISSLALTSVASSVALVTTNPLWVALLAWLLFREPLSRFSLLGLGVAFSGSLLIALSDSQVLQLSLWPTFVFSLDPSQLTTAGGTLQAVFGNALALLGAVTVAAYLLVGRSLRRRLSNTVYVWLVYSAAAVLMTLVTLVAGQSLGGYSLIAYAWLLLIAWGPQLLGHTAFNWALAKLSATFIALSILGEPIGSAILAYLLFGETFAVLQLSGFVMILTGIVLGILGEEGGSLKEANPEISESPV